MRIVRETRRPVVEIARDLGIGAGTLGNWVVLGRSDLPTLTKLASDVIEREVVEAFEEDFP